MTRLAIAAAAAAVALTGCSVHPGAAAVVGSDRISQDRVDEVAAALCAANAPSAAQPGAPALASRGARQGALQVLLDSELSRQFGEREGAEPSNRKVSAALAANAQSIASLPETHRDAFRAALKEYAEGQLVLIDIGRASLESQGETDVSDDEAIAEGSRLRAAYVASIDVEVDPRYGTFDDGSLQPSSGSLSVPASDGAVAGASSEPAAGWVAALPASQKCS